jgi:quercetin 2,3-dioxygenase
VLLKKTEMRNTVLHKANTRGNANHGWLNAYHSFSFGSWFNPERIQFGVLRVLNDDTIAAGMGFGTHPHDNMEIITIPLEGDLAHKDSMGNAETIKTGDIQVMSAGTGIQHSEFNPNQDKQTKLFQIWLFPKVRDVEPRYQQITLNTEDRNNKLQQILSPNPDDAGVWIYQDAWFHLGKFDTKSNITYQTKKAGNGVYVMLVSGEVFINGETLSERDAIGIWEESEATFNIDITINSASEILILEVPMK